jgi:hypothetical protein
MRVDDVEAIKRKESGSFDSTNASKDYGTLV